MNDNAQYEKVTERLRQEFAGLTDKEISASEAERKATKGTSRETAIMNENGEILMRVSRYLVDGSRSCGPGRLLVPGSKDYDSCLKEFGPLKPGQSREICKKWIDGQWVAQK